MPDFNGRACGSCTACCKIIGVEELKKPTWDNCRYCTAGKGCRIYPNRPASCMNFKCEWLKGFGDEEDRPDRSKVILQFVPNSLPGGVLHVWETRKDVLGKSALAREVTLKAVSNGVWVSHVAIRKRAKKLLVPRGRMVTEEVSKAMKKYDFEVE